MQTVWDLVLDRLTSRVAAEDIEEWLRPTQFLDQDDRQLRIRVPQDVFIDWIQDNYLPEIDDCLEELGQGHLKVVLVCPQDAIAPSQEVPELGPKTASTGSLKLNPRYHFDNFVIGSSNQFAHAAARAVAEAPFSSYNPLYIYGSSGLGKTHLLHAIAHQLFKFQPNLNICYRTCEEFTNQFINSIRFNKGEAFRERYRSVDVLLIDDIQFLSGKTQTQEEFFHTFNSLFEKQKTIIISSDCGPSHIPKLEARLKSRFQWGLCADIQPPALETRIAILKKKAAAENVDIPDDVLLFIASKVKSNVRELEGALIKVIASACLSHRKINMDLAEQCLQGIMREEGRAVSCDKIQRFVADRFNLTIKDLCSKNNSKRISQPRQIAMYLTRTLTGMSLPEIGLAFGNKHHSTVLYSIQKVEKEITDNPETRHMLATFKKSLS
ncbi:MAG: chromosomal replication initiator protein DnaA [Acidobacteria bacterium]|nr:chromosomal replication initiator protein DnaA [Acidobacteriota bacterium]MCB9396279.1 chromosomal replication initiator protein DnaA [Acidobacteriota bacterium]